MTGGSPLSGRKRDEYEKEAVADLLGATKKNMKRLAVSLLLGFLCLSVSAGIAWAKALETLHVEDLKAIVDKNAGKVIMLNFFATWCPPCRAEIPELVKAVSLYKGKNVVFIGLSVDDQKNKAKVEQFMNKMKISYPVYMAGRDVVLQFSIGSIPHNVFFDRSGKIIFSQPGECDVEDIKLVVEELLHDS
ncbi:MAG: redoxin domain-containing protein [Desulfovibrionaceae bacterium]|nr:redoxin domain-containing protein [Desulfovibrionaceae bacterium]